VRRPAFSDGAECVEHGLPVGALRGEVRVSGTFVWGVHESLTDSARSSGQAFAVAQVARLNESDKRTLHAPGMNRTCARQRSKVLGLRPHFRAKEACVPGMNRTCARGLGTRRLLDGPSPAVVKCLLCVEESHETCHRSVIAGAVAERLPRVAIVHL
jgi:hypothetical protein